jgi:hypothetical protein
MKRAVLIAVVALLALPGTGVAATRPTRLWHAFPLGTQTLPKPLKNHHLPGQIAGSSGPADQTSGSIPIGLVQVITISGIVAAILVLAPTAIIRRRAH